MVPLSIACELVAGGVIGILTDNKSRQRARRIASCSGLVASAVLGSGQAFAQCAPNPSQAGQAISCSGASSGGYAITTNSSPLTVTAGSSVENSGDAIAVSIPASGSYIARSASITVDGSVSSTNGNGITFLSGPSDGVDYDYYGTSGTITVNAGGSISGVTGITIARSPGYLSSNAPINLSIDNLGTIIGISGAALASGSGNPLYNSIANEAGGYLGAIAAPFQSLTNKGTIDGGSLSAVVNSLGGSITNTGTIQAEGAATTVSAVYSTLTNSGTITNTGTGAAISAANVSNLAGGLITADASDVIKPSSSTGSVSVANSGTIANLARGQAVSGNNVSVTNYAGGVISGGTAINAGTALTLVNTGSINGNVLAGSSPLYFGTSTVDSSLGTINGNLIFGSATNTLIATVNNGVLQTGVNGQITAGPGTNTVQIAPSTDTTISTPLALPTGFTQLSLAPAGGTTLTLANGFSSPARIYFDGNGTLANTGNLSGNGQIIGQTSFNTSGTLNNSGNITSANVSGPTAIYLNPGNGTFINTGIISASGDAIHTSGNYFTNSGTIIAGGSAANAYVGGTFVNSGSITSTGGTAVTLMQTCTCGTSTNSGSINGAQIGLNLIDGAIINTGTITSAGFGVALGTYGTIENQAGGTITGDTVAIGNPNGATGLASVSNAGTINGNVNLANSGFGTNTYYAMPGGILNGNLILGSGDTLVTDLNNTGTGAYAGIAGTVTANKSNLVFNVASNATTTAFAQAGFNVIAYQLTNNSTLTLLTGNTLTGTLGLAGSGTVILNQSIATYNASAVQSQSLITNAGISGTANALNIINNGTISSVTSNYSGSVEAAIALGGEDTLVNNGTITVHNIVGNNYTDNGAVFGGQSVTNLGTISGIGGPGVGIGNSGYGQLINSGTITSDQSAVYLFGAATITNSGTIASTGIAAIFNPQYYDRAQITNLAGGTITGNTDAVDMSGGTVSNAGTIKGNVDFSYSMFGTNYTYEPGVYIANGGTLNGNLIFGNVDGNALIETGSGFGIAGAITAGSGTNYIGHLRTSNATVMLGSTLPAGFSQEFVIASGPATQVTIQGPASSSANIYVGGDGSIVNQANTAGGVEGFNNLDTYTGSLSPYSTLQLASFTNQANVGFIDLTADTIANSGSVGSVSAVGPVVYQTFNGGLSFSNSGTIQTNINNLNSYGEGSTVLLSGSLGVGQISNSGAILGGLSVEFNPLTVSSAAPVLTITNSGTVTGAPYSIYSDLPGSLAVEVYGYTSFDPAAPPAINAPPSVSLTNSGTISGDIILDGYNNSLIDTATGSIIGNITLGEGYPSVGDTTNSVILAGAFTGNIDGGSDGTSLAVSGGSAAQPVAFGTLANIASYSQTAGYATLAGTASLGDATISGGTLVGLIGSTITTPLLTIGAKGTFASGGTINGSVLVNGALHVGASPDTMTVNGNVTLASGSTSIFEVSPTTSSKLVASGAVSIARGATLQIVELQPIMPGTKLNLISAGGGISGSFLALAGINGQLTEQGGSLSLLALFDTSTQQNPQAARGIGYVNSILASANASPALLAALPTLTASTGEPITQAFARLTAEPYASATQIGVENALTLSRAAREIDWQTELHSGDIFTFGQALGGWRGLNGEASRGTSTANISGYGFLGGLGISRGPVSVAAFGGYLDETQTTAALAASTQAKGFVGGVTGRLDSGQTRLAVSLLYDDAHATTQREAPDDFEVSAGYDLHSWSLDGELSTRLALGSDWTLRPHLGATWIWTRRGAADETTDSVFALTVAADHHTAGYFDGGLRFESPEASTNRFTRFLDLGLRWQLQGQSTQALAGFAGQPVTLLADGVRRGAASALVSAGGSYRITPAVSLFASGSGEMTKTGSSVSATGGIRMIF